VRVNIATSIHAVVRGDKTRKEYAVTLQRQRAAIVMQKRIKGRIAKKKLRSINDASIVIQSGKI
jgi:myosin-5